MYVFLLLSLYFIPVLNLSKQLLFSPGPGGNWERRIQFNLDCMYLGNKSLFFIINLLTWGLLGNMLELLRLPNVIRQLLAILGSASIPEMRVRSRAVAYDGVEFIFGEHMAYFLTNFSICCFVVNMCPLIGPFGLLYSIIKHAVDSYNLIVGAYRPSKVDVRQFYLIVANILLFIGLASTFNMVTYLRFRIKDTSAHATADKYGPVILIFMTVLCLVQIQSQHRYPIPLFQDRKAEVFAKSPSSISSATTTAKTEPAPPDTSTLKKTKPYQPSFLHRGNWSYY